MGKTAEKEGSLKKWGGLVEQKYRNRLRSRACDRSKEGHTIEAITTLVIGKAGEGIKKKKSE